MLPDTSVILSCACHVGVEVEDDLECDTVLFYVYYNVSLPVCVCVHLVDTLHKSTFVASVFGESGSLFWFATAVFCTYL